MGHVYGVLGDARVAVVNLCGMKGLSVALQSSHMYSVLREPLTVALGLVAWQPSHTLEQRCSTFLEP